MNKIDTTHAEFAVTDSLAHTVGFSFEADYDNAGVRLKLNGEEFTALQLEQFKDFALFLNRFAGHWELLQMQEDYCPRNKINPYHEVGHEDPFCEIKMCINETHVLDENEEE